MTLDESEIQEGMKVCGNANMPPKYERLLSSHLNCLTDKSLLRNKNINVIICNKIWKWLLHIFISK